MHAKKSNMSNPNVKCINRRNELIENVTKEVSVFVLQSHIPRSIQISLCGVNGCKLFE